MWLADPAGDVGSTVTGPWGVIAVALLVAGSLGAIVLRAKFTKSSEPVAPVAAKSAEAAVEEYKKILIGQLLEPLEAELDEERRDRIGAERARANAERVAESLRANLISSQERLAECQERLRRALSDLAEERRDRPSPP